MNGFGKFMWADGRVYEGHYYQDKKHGKGIYKWPDGRNYEGNFKKGL